MSQPIYVKIKEMILNQIENGVLGPGDKLASERALAEEHGLSRMTVRQALTDLVNSGALYREQGRGTFVSARKMQQRNISSFSETVRLRGFEPSTRVMEFQTFTPPDSIAKRLMTGGEVYRAMRIRFADETPVAVEEVFLPAHICPGLEKSALLGSLYNLLTDTYGHKIGSADCSISTLLPGARFQEYLNVARQTPLLRVNSLYFLASGGTLYYERAIYRTDMYEYNVRIATQPV
ncbi:MAG: GntR family transcriptional regulator [Christensenellales bacterium]